MVYPAILLTGVVGLFLLLMLFVMPRFMGIFHERRLRTAHDDPRVMAGLAVLPPLVAG